MGAIRKRGAWWYRFWHKESRPKSPYEQGPYKTKQEAIQAEQKKREEAGATKFGRTTKPVYQTPFSKVIEYYLHDVSEKHANYRHERYAFGLMVDRWASRSLSGIPAYEVEAHKEELLRSGLTGATVNRHLAYLNSLYRWAAKRGFVPKDVNPASGEMIRREKETFRPWVILTQEQKEAILEHFESKPTLRAALILLMNLGARKGVVYGLRWEQIDWEHGLIRYHSKGRTNTIPMNETARETLTGLRELYGMVDKERPDLGLKNEGKVFPFVTDSSLRREFYKIRDEIGLPSLRLHDLRVTFARELAEAGASIKTIQTLLGHATPTMTLRYIPANLDEMRDAVKRLDPKNGLKTVGPNVVAISQTLKKKA